MNLRQRLKVTVFMKTTISGLASSNIVIPKQKNVTALSPPYLGQSTLERLSIPVDVRVICATHQDLTHSIEVSGFREDLYYRVSEIVIKIPPLREGDRVLLAQNFLDTFSRKNGRHFRGFTDQALIQIDAYPWPGNVREMENKVKRAVILAEGKQITVGDLGFTEQNEPCSLNLVKAREQVERQLVERALAIHNHNISHAAEALGISRPSLYKLFIKLNMAEPGK